MDSVSTQPCVPGTNLNPCSAPDLDVHEVHRSQNVSLTVERGFSAAAVDQEAPDAGARAGARSRSSHAGRSARNGLAMHHIRQVAVLAEQIVDLDGRIWC